MNLKKRIFAVFCAAVMLFTLSVPPAQASNDLIFIALNDQLVKLTANTMPIYSYNSYYVPYLLFDKVYMTANFGVSVDLGVNVSVSNNKVMLYNKRRQLTYDLDAGTCTDGNGNNYKRAIVIGGVTYLPIASVRDFFREDGLSYTQSGTPYGPLLRLSTPSAFFGDAEFADAAVGGIPQIIKDYNRDQNPSPSPSVSPTISPSTPPSVSPSPGQEPDKSGVKVYLSFQCTGGAGTVTLLDLLDREGVSALFFFAPDTLAENETLVRRIVGSGHAIGLTVPGGPTEDAKALLTEGNRLLSLIAHTNTRTISILNGDSAVTIALEAAGWSVWTDNVPVSPVGKTATAFSTAMMKIVDAKRAVARITLSDQASAASALPLLLNALRGEKYDIRLAVGGVFG